MRAAELRARVASRWVVWAVVGLTVVGGGLRASAAAAPNPRQSRDEDGYVSAAIRLIDSGSYGKQSLHWPPGAPLLFALAGRIDGRHVLRGPRPDVPAAYWAQWAVGTALIPVVFTLAWLLGGVVAGLASAAVVATYPPLIAVTGDLLSEPLGALWLTAAVLVLAWAARGGWRPRPVALSGALLGAASLTRANLLVVLPAVALALGLSDRRRAALLATAALAPVALWSLNASIGSGRLVPICTGGGTAFFIGTFLPGHGTLLGAKIALAHEVRRFAPELRRVRHARSLPAERVMDAVAARHPGMDRDAALRREAWRNVSAGVRQHPLAYAAMVLAKLPRLWLVPSPRSGGLRTLALRIWHALVVLVALAGLLLGALRARDPVLSAVLALLAAFTAFHMVVEALPRYALPAFPVLMAAGAAGWALTLRDGRAIAP